MKSFNQMGLDVFFRGLIEESKVNNTVEFNNYVYQVLDDYKESYDLQEGTDVARVEYMKLSDLF